MLYIKGIIISDKTFKFLGFSNSQMRGLSVWTANVANNAINPNTILMEAGTIKESNVSKFASRYAQCFTTTIPTVDQKTLPFKVSFADDVIKGNYIFTDGIGKISPLLVNEVMKLFYKEDPVQLSKMNSNISNYGTAVSAIQFRFQGAKGVLCVSNELKGYEIVLRNSQIKFLSNDTIIEVTTSSLFHFGFLNRQMIILLSSRGIKDEAIRDLHNTYQEKIMKLPSNAIIKEKLFFLRSHSFRSAYSIIENMIIDGLPPTEPFLKRYFRSVSNESLKALKTKTRILVEKSANLFGVSDEHKTLNYGEIFCQIQDPETGKLHVVLGSVFVTKNPSLYPSDIRVVRAVDREELRYLFNVIVFPQKGKRPHPNEISGSDLDGDRYFITWDERIVPQEDCIPPEFKTVKGEIYEGKIELENILDSMLTYHQSCCLGIIANTHIKIADQLVGGANHPLCILLAEQHSIEVDAPKTGKHGVIPTEVTEYLKEHRNSSNLPDYMEKEVYRSYKSNSIIGALYRSVKDESTKLLGDNEDIEINIKMQRRGWKMYEDDMTLMFRDYIFDMKQLMSDYDLNEYQLLSGCSGVTKDTFLDYEEMKEKRKVDVSRIIRWYRKRFINMHGDYNLMGSAAYIVSYKYKDFLSFPWVVAYEELLSMANYY